jgi:hypothetical protein
VRRSHKNRLINNPIVDEFIVSQRKKRSLALAVFLGTSVAFGIVDLLLYQNAGWESCSWILNTIVGVVAIVAWCRYDSQIRGYPLSASLKLLIWLIALIGVPVYLVQSRGWKGAAKLGFGLPVFLLNAGLYYGGWYAAREIGARVGYFQ